MNFLINIFLWIVSGLLKYQPSTEQNPPFASIYLSGVVVLTILSRMVLFIMGNPHVNVKNVVNRLCSIPLIKLSLPIPNNSSPAKIKNLTLGKETGDRLRPWAFAAVRRIRQAHRPQAHRPLDKSSPNVRGPNGDRRLRGEKRQETTILSIKPEIMSNLSELLDILTR